MQIKLATARGLGYTGDAAGLRDPNTNLTYAVKYLAGAYRAANGDHDRAVHYFAGGYYYVAKRQRLADPRPFQPELATRRGNPPADVVPPPHQDAGQCPRAAGSWRSSRYKPGKRALTPCRIGLH